MDLCFVLSLSSTAYERLLRSLVSCAHLRVTPPNHQSMHNKIVTLSAKKPEKMREKLQLLLTHHPFPVLLGIAISLLAGPRRLPDVEPLLNNPESKLSFRSTPAHPHCSGCPR